MRLITSLSFGLLISAMAVMTACQSSESPASTTENGTEATVSNSPGDLHIVYINADSLQSGYTALSQELARLEENYAAAEANHQQRVRSLQREVQNLQNQIQRGELSQNRIGQEQQRIGQREQEIVQQQQLSLNSIQEETVRLQEQFTTEVTSILEALKAENSYDFVFSLGTGTGLLLANEGYDITGLVLERLNAATPVDATEAATEETTED